MFRMHMFMELFLVCQNFIFTKIVFTQAEIDFVIIRRKNIYIYHSILKPVYFVFFVFSPYAHVVPRIRIITMLS